MEKKLINEQKKLLEKLVICPLDFSLLNLIAGVDLAYFECEGEQRAVCSIVVIDYKTKQVVEQVSLCGKVEMEYIPGFLAFREIPLFLQTNELLTSKVDLYVFDGNGYLHPRHMGLATHAGIVLNKPSIGVAKTYYKINDVNYTMPDDKEGAFTDIVIDGEVYGRAVRTIKSVKPIFVSVGNKCDIESATKLALSLTGKESHIPLPTRLADNLTHIERNKFKK